MASMPETITLVGLSGSGKSSVGRTVAAALGRPFVDLDQRISAVAGGSPATIIGRDGEARFREIEAAEVRKAVAVPGAVIATGGGAVIDPLSRWALWDAGQAVWLDAPDVQLAARLRRSDEQRPLVAGDTEAALARLRAAREPFYAAADVRIESKGSAKTVAAAVIEAVSGPRPHARRLFDARVRRDHQMGPRVSHMVYGRDLDVAMLEPIIGQRVLGRARGGRRRDRRRGPPGPHGRVPGGAPAACDRWRAREADALGGATAGGGGGAASRAWRRLDRDRRRHDRATSWGPRRPCISGACRWCRYPRRGSPSPTPPSAARSPSTSPRPRTRRAPSGRPWP